MPRINKFANKQEIQLNEIVMFDYLYNYDAEYR